MRENYKNSSILFSAVTYLPQLAAFSLQKSCIILVRIHAKNKINNSSGQQHFIVGSKTNSKTNERKQAEQSDQFGEITTGKLYKQHKHWILCCAISALLCNFLVIPTPLYPPPSAPTPSCSHHNSLVLKNESWPVIHQSYHAALLQANANQVST